MGKGRGERGAPCKGMRWRWVGVTRYDAGCCAKHVTGRAGSGVLNLGLGEGWFEYGYGRVVKTDGIAGVQLARCEAGHNSAFEVACG